MSSEEARRVLRDMPVRGLWAPVVIEGRSLFTNDPASHPASVGVPQGHPPIECFLGVPLKDGGRTTAFVGLANKAGGIRMPTSR